MSQELELPPPARPESPWAQSHHGWQPPTTTEPPSPPPPQPGPLRRRWQRRSPWLVPILLFAATCISTVIAGHGRYGIGGGLLYAGAVMLILTCHEMGHWLQARKYSVPASLPYFIPMPFSPLGTMGAIIAMRSRITSTRALFDIGIAGPLAGLVPTLLLTVIGLKLSTVAERPPDMELFFGSPLLFSMLIERFFEPLGPDQVLLFHPFARAGWVGILITALNPLPVGQLDGGHILYALLRRWAHLVSFTILVLAAMAVVLGGYWMWSLMLLILILMGHRHPPTSDPEVPLGWGRALLGWLTLGFLILGFTPQPIIFIPL